MKKVLCVIIASIAIVSGSFAREKVVSDVQLNLGYSKVYLNTDTKYDSGIGEIKAKATTKGDTFIIGLQSWTFINNNDWFGIGFNVGADFYAGTYTTTKGTIEFNGEKEDYNDSNPKNTATGFRLAFGPAASFTFNNIVQLNCAIDFVFSTFDKYVFKDSKMGNTLEPSLGLGTDIQVKFLPNKSFSPVLGCRMQIVFPINGYLIEDGKKINDSKFSGDDYSVGSIATYVGGSFNF